MLSANRQHMLTAYLKDVDMLQALFLSLHLYSKQILLKRQVRSHIPTMVFLALVLWSTKEKTLERQKVFC